MRLMRTTRTLGFDPGLAWPEVVRSPALWRYAAYLVLLGICLLFYTWSRIGTTETALQLDASRSRLARLQTENARLRVELEYQRSPARLHARARAGGLTDEVPVVEVY